MPFAPHVIDLLETILSDGFGYHTGLDAFITRAGIPKAKLTAARAAAEERAKSSARGFGRAPKRYVAQEILALLGSGTSEDDRLLASLVTAACKLDLKVASDETRGQRSRA